MCLPLCFCQFGGRPLLAVRHLALWEPLSVCEQGPDEGPQGLPARRSHQTALLQMAERSPAGCARNRRSGQESPISGEEKKEERRKLIKEANQLTVFIYVFLEYPQL